MPRGYNPAGFVFSSGTMGKFMSNKETYGKALVAAAMEGNLELVELLLASGASVNANNHSMESNREDSGSTALIIAVRYGYKKCVDALLRFGADVNIKQDDASTALMVAAGCKNPDSNETVRLLIESGADVNATNYHRESAFSRGSETGSALTMKLLLESGADLDATDILGRTALMTAAAWANDDVVNVLIEEGADVNQWSYHGGTPLMNASGNCSPSTIELLLKLGAKVNATKTDGWNSLMFVLHGNYYGDDLTENFLIRNIVDSPFTPFGSHNKPFRTRPETYPDFPNPNELERPGELECMNVLLSAGIDVNHATREGWTPFMIASMKRNIDIVKRLLDSGANVNPTWDNNWNALISAIVVWILYSRGRV